MNDQNHREMAGKLKNWNGHHGLAIWSRDLKIGLSHRFFKTFTHLKQYLLWTYMEQIFLPVHFLLRMSKNRFSARAPTPKPLMLGTWNFRYHLVTVVGHSNCLFMLGNGRLSPFSTGWKIAKTPFFTQLKRGLNVHSQTWKDNWSVPPRSLGDI